MSRLLRISVLRIYSRSHSHSSAKDVNNILISEAIDMCVFVCVGEEYFPDEKYILTLTLTVPPKILNDILNIFSIDILKILILENIYFCVVVCVRAGKGAQSR